MFARQQMSRVVGGRPRFTHPALARGSGPPYPARFSLWSGSHSPAAESYYLLRCAGASPPSFVRVPFGPALPKACLGLRFPPRPRPPANRGLFSAVTSLRWRVQRQWAGGNPV